MINQSSKTFVVMALALILIAAVQGNKAYRTMINKAQAQADVTESVKRWKQNYMALGKSSKRWEHDYRHQGSVPHLLALFAIINLDEYGISTNTDAMILNKVEPVAQNGMPIGLTKVCFTTNGGGDASALEVHASSYQMLLGGIKRLAQRPDIHIGTISIKGDKSIPVANLGDFCILLSK